MQSMTGFGRSELATEIGNVVIEVKSENHRFLDVYIQMPESLSSLERRLAELVKKTLSRGKLRVTVSAEGLGARASGINTEAAKRLVESLTGLKKELGINGDVRLEHLLMMKDLFAAEEKPAITPEVTLEIEKGVKEAVKNLNKMRKSEGGKLRKDLKKRVLRLKELVEQVQNNRESFAEKTAAKLRERIDKLLEGAPMDEYRLTQEVAFLAERSDITEEIVRLGAHTEKFSENLDRREPVGRELDFLLQEMNREATTIAAKAKDAVISHIIVELKSELERMREQVQNIE